MNIQFNNGGYSLGEQSSQTGFLNGAIYRYFPSGEDYFTEALQLIAAQKDVKRVMVIPDEAHYDEVRSILRKMDDDEKRITVFAMQPMAGGNFRQEILGYSLMAALGIKGEEIK